MSPIFHNPQALRGADYPSELRELLDREQAREALATLSSWPGYRESPLRPLPGLAAELSLAEVWAKDESERFGLGSFKALGGAYAVHRLVREQGGAEGGPLTVCSATAGNHGRSVAWGARMFGCRCVVYLPAATARERVDAIAALGAEVVRVPGTYDDAVRRAAADAEANGWRVVSDTSYAGYTEVPLTVMRGYTVMTEEIAARWGDREPPSHLFLQCGVGGLAAAAAAGLWELWGARRPRTVVVEPDRAACMLESAREGRPVHASGDLDTEMSCLACGEVSTVAWEVLRRAAGDFLTVSDEDARRAVRRLQHPEGGDPAIRSAPSGAAGLAGLLRAATDAELRGALGLDADSRVLLFVSEGRPQAAPSPTPPIPER